MKKLKEALEQIAETNEMVSAGIARKALKSLTKTELLLADLQVDSGFEDLCNDDKSFLAASVEFGGAMFHIDAVRVVNEDGNAAPADGNQERIDQLDVLTSNVGYQTVKINRLRYVIYMHPAEP